MKALDMTKVYRDYKGKWVALKSFTSNPEVVASGKILKETLEKAEKKGFKHPVVTQIPKKILPIVGIL